MVFGGVGSVMKPNREIHRAKRGADGGAVRDVERFLGPVAAGFRQHEGPPGEFARGEHEQVGLGVEVQLLGPGRLHCCPRESSIIDE
jgi:hypothetical protein